MQLNIGNEVEIVNHCNYKGRTGVITDFGTKGVFDDWCKVLLTAKPRERTTKRIFIETKYVQLMSNKKTTPLTDYKYIAVKDIEPDANQPRKFFDEDSLTELSASIKASGVLQPIMVRPQGKKYLLVYGERRLKACLLAGVKEIPANIRELTDAEALDIQITENLQRKDVHPMEEAVAFSKLAEKSSIEDIALRVGKSESFVAKRIQLTKLVELAQQLFFSNHLIISHALKLAKLEQSTQTEILSQLIDEEEDWQHNKDFELSTNKLNNYISSNEVKLSKAPFSLSDKTLYPGAGACTSCKFNSSNTPLLFDEHSLEPICNKPSCFAIKKDNFQYNKLQELAANTDVIIVCGSSYLTDSEKRKLDAAKEMGIDIIERKKFELIDTPDPVKNYELWLEEDYYADDDDTEEYLKEQYNTYVQELEEETKQFNESVETGNIATVIDVLTLEEIQVRFFNTDTVKNITQSSNGEQIAVKNEIEKLNQKEERNKELDDEKVWGQIKDLLADEANQDALYNTNTFTKIETRAITAAIHISLSYSIKRLAEKRIGFDSYKHNVTTYNYKPTDLDVLQRFFLIDKLISSVGSHTNGGTNKLAYEVLKQYFKADIGKIEIDQQNIAAARVERLNKKLSALKEKLIMNA